MAVSFIPMLRFYRLSPLWAPLLPLIALGYMAFTLDFAYQHTSGPRRLLEGPRASRYGRRMMTDAAQLRSGKGHRDENFPVASHLIAKRHRALILAFYEFVRTADDVADNATLTERQKIDLLDGLEAMLVGTGGGNPQAVCAARRR